MLIVNCSTTDQVRSSDGSIKLRSRIAVITNSTASKNSQSSMVHGMPSSEETPASADPMGTTPSTTTPPTDEGLPRKRILSQAHLKAFKESDTYKDIVDFVDELNVAIVGKKLSDTRAISPVRNVFTLCSLVPSSARNTF